VDGRRAFEKPEVEAQKKSGSLGLQPDHLSWKPTGAPSQSDRDKMLIRLRRRLFKRIGTGTPHREILEIAALDRYPK
jgi:hypothetical protein